MSLLATLTPAYYSKSNINVFTLKLSGFKLEPKKNGTIKAKQNIYSCISHMPKTAEMHKQDVWHIVISAQDVSASNMSGMWKLSAYQVL